MRSDNGLGKNNGKAKKVKSVNNALFPLRGSGIQCVEGARWFPLWKKLMLSIFKDVQAPREREKTSRKPI